MKRRQIQRIHSFVRRGRRIVSRFVNFITNQSQNQIWTTSQTHIQQQNDGQKRTSSPADIQQENGGQKRTTSPIDHQQENGGQKRTTFPTDLQQENGGQKRITSPIDLQQENGGQKRTSSPTGIQQENGGQKKNSSPTDIQQENGGQKKNSSPTDIQQENGGQKRITSPIDIQQENGGQKRTPSPTNIQQENGGQKRTPSPTNIQQENGGQKRTPSPTDIQQEHGGHKRATSPKVTLQENGDQKRATSPTDIQQENGGQKKNSSPTDIQQENGGQKRITSPIDIQQENGGQKRTPSPTDIQQENGGQKRTPSPTDIQQEHGGHKRATSPKVTLQENGDQKRATSPTNIQQENGGQKRTSSPTDIQQRHGSQPADNVNASMHQTIDKLSIEVSENTPCVFARKGSRLNSTDDTIKTNCMEETSPKTIYSNLPDDDEVGRCDVIFPKQVGNLIDLAPAIHVDRNIEEPIHSVTSHCSRDVASNSTFLCYDDDTNNTYCEPLDEASIKFLKTKHGTEPSDPDTDQKCRDPSESLRDPSTVNKECNEQYGRAKIISLVKCHKRVCRIQQNTFTKTGSFIDAISFPNERISITENTDISCLKNTKQFEGQSNGHLLDFENLSEDGDRNICNKGNKGDNLQYDSVSGINPIDDEENHNVFSQQMDDETSLKTANAGEPDNADSHEDDLTPHLMEYRITGSITQPRVFKERLISNSIVLAIDIEHDVKRCETNSMKHIYNHCTLIEEEGANEKKSQTLTYSLVPTFHRDTCFVKELNIQMYVDPYCDCSLQNVEGRNEQNIFEITESHTKQANFNQAVFRSICRDDGGTEKAKRKEDNPIFAHNGTLMVFEWSRSFYQIRPETFRQIIVAAPVLKEHDARPNLEPENQRDESESNAVPTNPHGTETRLFPHEILTESSSDVYKFELARYKTFWRFPLPYPVSPTLFARNGFYYEGNGDEVVCFCCKVKHGNWRSHEDINAVHARISRNCPFICGQPTDNIPFQEDPTSATQMSDELQRVYDIERQHREQNSPGARGIHTERYHYPDYAGVAIRANTFRASPPQLAQTATQMAMAGFFYAGYGDYVRCFFCGRELGNWEPGDDPWVEHAKYCPECNYVKTMKGQQFIDQACHNQEIQNTDIISEGGIGNRDSAFGSFGSNISGFSVYSERMNIIQTARGNHISITDDSLSSNEHSYDERIDESNENQIAAFPPTTEFDNSANNQAIAHRHSTSTTVQTPYESSSPTDSAVLVVSGSTENIAFSAVANISDTFFDVGPSIQQSTLSSTQAEQLPPNDNTQRLIIHPLISIGNTRLEMMVCMKCRMRAACSIIPECNYIVCRNCRRY